MARTAKRAASAAAATPETGPTRYRARVYHEIEVGDGVKRVEPGYIVVDGENGIDVYPPERFAEAFPDMGDIPDQE